MGNQLSKKTHEAWSAAYEICKPHAEKIAAGFVHELPKEVRDAYQVIKDAPYYEVSNGGNAICKATNFYRVTGDPFTGFSSTDPGANPDYQHLHVGDGTTAKMLKYMEGAAYDCYQAKSRGGRPRHVLLGACGVKFEAYTY